jgi:excisionase family DNA binding protein
MKIQQCAKAAYAIAEVCDVTTLGRTTVFGEIKKGNLRVVRVGRRTLVLASELERFIERLTPQS